MATISEQEYVTRVKQLEALNARLAEQVDRMRPVVETAIGMREHGCGQCEADLDRAVDKYQHQLAELMKEGG